MEIYRDDTDRGLFLETLTEVCARAGWVIHAFVLMDDHYHILLETPGPNLVVGMKWFQGTYTQRSNARRKIREHLFQGRYRALMVDNGSDAYFPLLSSYIHLDPARAGLFDLKSGDLSDFVWSSYPLYLRASKRPEWLCVERVLNCHGAEDTRKGRVWYRQYIKQLVDEIVGSKGPYQMGPNWSKIRHGWCLGSNAFRDSLLDRLDALRSKRKRSSFSGPEVQMHDERRAMRLLSVCLKQLGLTNKTLKSLPKGASEKKALIWYIRSKTTVSNDRLSEHIFCGHPNNIPRSINEVKGKKNKVLNRLVKAIRIYED